MKKIKVSAVVVIVLTVGFIVIQCQHNDQVVIPVVGPDPIKHGTQIITCTDCNTDTNVSGSWYHDQAHSNVMWETPYMGTGSLLTGRFNEFFMTNLNFDEGVPANITFEGYVWLNTVNTGEPARDGGCLLTSFKTVAYDPANTGDVNNADANKAILKAKAGSGRYSTTDAGFLVDCQLTFLGATNDVTVKIFFYPITESKPNLSGISTEFSMTPKDFGLTDSNIGDMVTIRINNTMKLN